MNDPVLQIKYGITDVFVARSECLEFTAHSDVPCLKKERNNQSNLQKDAQTTIKNEN